MALLEKIHELINRKFILLRQYDRKEINEKEFIGEINPIETEIDNLTKERIKLMQEELNQKHNNIEKEMKTFSKKEDVKMTEDVEVKPNVVKGKKRENSMAATIEKALKMKSVKNATDVVAKVKEILPSKTDKQIKSMLSAIIREVKTKKPRWCKYTWDEQNYKLVEKV